MTCKENVELPGHTTRGIQFLFCIFGPSHGLPPFTGSLNMSLVLTWDPCPHVLEQLVQSVKPPHSQSTGIGRAPLIALGPDKSFTQNNEEIIMSMWEYFRKIYCILRNVKYLYHIGCKVLGTAAEHFQCCSLVYTCKILAGLHKFL